MKDKKVILYEVEVAEPNGEVRLQGRQRNSKLTHQVVERIYTLDGLAQLHYVLKPVAYTFDATTAVLIAEALNRATYSA